MQDPEFRQLDVVFQHAAPEILCDVVARHGGLLEPEVIQANGDIDMSRQRQTILIAVLTWVVTTLSAGCALAPSREVPPQTGRVLGMETRRPIEGAILVLRWQGVGTKAFVDTQTVCYHIESTVTDSDGRYATAAWREEHRHRDLSMKQVLETVYKPGYRHVRLDRATGTQYLKKDVGSVMERLGYMRSISHAGSCGPESQRRDKTLAFYESLYREAISITGSSPDDAEISKYVDGFEYSLDVVKNGWDVAEGKRMEEFKRLEEANRRAVIIGPGEPETMLTQ